MNNSKKLLNLIALVVLVSTNIFSPLSYATAGEEDKIEVPSQVESEETFTLDDNEESTDQDENETSIDSSSQLSQDDNSVSSGTESEETFTLDDMENSKPVDFLSQGFDSGQQECYSGKEEISAIDMLKHVIDDFPGDILLGEGLTGDIETFTLEVENLSGEIEKSELDIAWEILNTDVITGTDKSKGVVVNVEALTGTFPEGTQLRILPITIKKELNEIKEQIMEVQDGVVENSEIVAFDISFVYTLSDGEEIEVQPKNGEGVKVSFNYEENKSLSKAEQSEEQEVKVFHIDDKDVEGEEIRQLEIDEKATTEGEVVVDAKSFSVYVVITTTISNPKITYDLNGGYWTEEGINATEPKEVAYSYGNAATIKTRTPSKGDECEENGVMKKCMFDGWYLTGLETRRTGNVTSNMTVYAKWLPFEDMEVTLSGTTITLMDRNLGAIVAGTGCAMDNTGTCGYHFQRGNNYGIPDNYSGATDSPIKHYSTYWKSYISNYYNSKLQVYESTVGEWGASSTNYNLWGGELSGSSDSLRQGPCPDGYHIPDILEWEALGMSLNAKNDKDNVRDTLNLPFAGSHGYSNYSVNNFGTFASYWSSTPIKPYNAGSVGFARFDARNSSSYEWLLGRSVRCFKNSPIYELTFSRSGKTIKTGKVRWWEPINNSYKPKTPIGMTENWYTDEEKTELFIFSGGTYITGSITLYSDLTYREDDLELYFLDGSGVISHYTIMDRNLGASEVYNRQYNTTNINTGSFGYHYQWGNNYGFQPCYALGSWCETFPGGEYLQQFDLEDRYGNFETINTAYIPSKYVNNTYATNVSSRWYVDSNIQGIWGGMGDYQELGVDENGDEYWLPIGANTTLEGRQGPCPDGYHVPSDWEWNSMYNSWYKSKQNIGNIGVQIASDWLLPPAGIRDNQDARGYAYNNDLFNVYGYGRTQYVNRNKPRVMNQGVNGEYWSSTIYDYWSSSSSYNKGRDDFAFANEFSFSSSQKQLSYGKYLTMGLSVRCAKNSSDNEEFAINVNGGKKAVIAFTGTVGDGTFTTLSTPIRDKSKFLGWYDSLAGGNKIETGSNVVPNLYARWECDEGFVDDGVNCVKGLDITIVNQPYEGPSVSKEVSANITTAHHLEIVEMNYAIVSTCDESTETIWTPYVNEEIIVLDSEDYNNKYVCFKAKNSIGDVVYKATNKVEKIDTVAPVCERGEPSNTPLKAGGTGTITLTCVDTGVKLSTGTLRVSDIMMRTDGLLTLLSADDATLSEDADGYTVTYGGKSYTLAKNDLEGVYKWGNNIPGDSANYNGEGNNNRWGGGGDISSNGYDSGNPRSERQGPCPLGYHVPSRGERINIIELRCYLPDNDCTKSDINLTYGSINKNGLAEKFKLDFGMSSENYWSSTPSSFNNFAYNSYIACHLHVYYGGIYTCNSERGRSYNSSVRCLKDTSSLPSQPLNSQPEPSNSQSESSKTYTFIYTAKDKVNGSVNFILPENIVKDSAGNSALTTTSTIPVVVDNTATYSVEYYIEKLDGTYEMQQTGTEVGTIDTEITAMPKEIEGFTFSGTYENNVPTGMVLDDGSLVLKLYYTRNSYDVEYQFSNEPSGYSPLPITQKYKYGESVTIESDATAPGYTFAWNTGNFIMPARNVVITGVFTLISSSIGSSGGGKNKVQEDDNHNSAGDENDGDNPEEDPQEDDNKGGEDLDLNENNDIEWNGVGTGAIGTGQTLDLISKGKGSSSRGSYTREQVEAYTFAKNNGITSISTIEDAQMNGDLTRIQMAKMLSQYAINVLGQTPDTSKNIDFRDVTKKKNTEYDNGVTLAYQLGIMGQNMPNNKFRPDDEVLRAEFIAALSRMLYSMDDGIYKSTRNYYKPHMFKLYNEGIINKVDPDMKEKRGYVMIMLNRASK